MITGSMSHHTQSFSNNTNSSRSPTCGSRVCLWIVSVACSEGLSAYGFTISDVPKAFWKKLCASDQIDNAIRAQTAMCARPPLLTWHTRRDLRVMLVSEKTYTLWLPIAALEHVWNSNEYHKNPMTILLSWRILYYLIFILGGVWNGKLSKYAY
jgi:hypothetical protein